MKLQHCFKGNPFAQLIVIFLVTFGLLFSGCGAEADWKPNTDWGHWRLGQKSDLDFLQANNMTITFGSGAPSFEYVTRDEFDQRMDEAKAFNKSYHDKGYIVLRYLSTSLNGNSLTNSDTPLKEQLDLLKFYNERWDDFADYIGPKPPVDEDPTTWITIRPDGSFPHYRYARYGSQTDEGFETWGCPHNPYYVRMMEGRIRAQAETGIDGSYVDWTQIASGTCYCDYTKQAFKKYLEENLPKAAAEAKYGSSDYTAIILPEHRSDDYWMEWITFRGQAVAEFHDRLRTVARQYNPHFMISGNVFGGFGYGPIAYDAAGNIEYLGQVDDFVYSEMQEFLDSAPRRNADGVKITNSPALKFLAAATHGKPVIVYATEITPPIFPDPTEKCLSAMAQINIAEAIANHAIFREKRQTPPGATAIYSFLSANEAALTRVQLHSNVAILASLGQYLADEQSYAFSLSRVMADRGMGHVIIVEDDLLDGSLAKYDLVILPNIPLLSQQKQLALVEFVKGGGVLIILGETGIKDEYGVPMNAIPLVQAMDRDTFPPQSARATLGEGRIIYLPLTASESGFLIPAEEKAAVTTFGPAMLDVFADVPEGYTRNRMNAQLRRNLEGLLRRILGMLKDQVSRLLKSAKYVEMTTMLAEENDRLLVHLVNYDVTLDGTITPATDLKIQVLIPNGLAARSASYSGSLGEMIPLTFQTKQVDAGQLVLLEVDNLEIYGLAVIDLQSVE